MIELQEIRNQSLSLKINLVLNVVKTFVSMCFPLITYPYITRIFSVEDVGKINFYLSIISYFQLIAYFGIPTYAVSVGSGKRDNMNWFNSFANEVYSLSVLSTFSSCSLLGVMVGGIHSFSGEWRIWVVLSVSIIFNVWGAEWLLQVYEDYFFMTVRYILIQIAGVVLLFIFVQNSTDMTKYFIIYVIPYVLTGVSNRLYVKKYCRLKTRITKEIQFHFKAIIPIFFSNIATLIYINSDITMLGILCGEKSVGLYSISTKIYNVIKNIFIAMIAVYIPRMSLLIQKKELLIFRKKIHKLIIDILLLSIAASVGIIGLGSELISIFAGLSYLEGVKSLQILAAAMVFAVLNGINTTVILIPLREEKLVLKATICSAVLNLILNLIFLPVYQQNGAALTTLIAEIVLFMITTRRCNNFNIYKNLSKKIVKNIVVLIPIIICIIIICKVYIKNMFIRCIVTTIVSIAWYVSIKMFMDKKDRREN